MSLQPEVVPEARAARAPRLDRHPCHIAPDPYGFLCGWWAHRRTDPRRLFGLGPAGPRG